jgi:signal transduction histidine kinase
VTSAHLRQWIHGRYSVRARITLASAGLFLVTGSAFITALYVLVDHSLGPTVTQVPSSLLRACQEAKFTHSFNLHPTLSAMCPLGPNDRTRYLDALLTWSIVGLGVATVVAGILGWAVGRRILRPIHAVTAAARHASQERLDRRINLGGREDELKELADTFDDMLSRLDQAFTSQRRFVANASHELRTPLASMRTLIDVAIAKPNKSVEQLESLIRSIREELAKSEAIIDGLLTLARSDRGLATKELADLEVAAQDAIERVTPAASTARISVKTELTSSPVLGDRVLLERLVTNLLENAVSYNRTNGMVSVVTGTDGSDSFITVTNTGPVVPEESLESLSEPFTRLDCRVVSGSGAGLGLSIVKSVSEAHHGHFLAEPIPEGGLTISVRIPRASMGNSGDGGCNDEVIRDPEGLLVEPQ